jgi:hypothetical protein
MTSMPENWKLARVSVSRKIAASPSQDLLAGIAKVGPKKARIGAFERKTKKGKFDLDYVSQLILAVTAERKERENLHAHYAGRFSTNADLSRALVSFQANRSAPFYRWLKYREGFSTALVSHLLETGHNVGGYFKPEWRNFLA